MIQIIDPQFRRRVYYSTDENTAVKFSDFHGGFWIKVVNNIYIVIL